MISRRSLLRNSLFPVTGLYAAPASRYFIEIQKRERQLALFLDRRLTHTFPVSLGFAPLGHKQRQGDGRTPEGEYRTVLRNRQSRFYRSVMLNYPLPEDGRRGVAEGIISPKTRDAILTAHRTGAIPVQNTALGGEIFIHGGGGRGDWTLGCIALENRDMDVIFALPVGIRVTITP